MAILEGKRVLVTGAAGFLGSWLCESLLDDGCEVVGVDNLVSGMLQNLDNSLTNKDFSFIKDDAATTTPSGAANVVAHFASPASPQLCDKYPIETMMANSQGTRNMLEIARKNDAVFLYASTSEVYGEPAVVPTPETYPGNVDPLGARAHYEESKRFGEALCMSYVLQYGLDTRIIRIFNSYGPRQRFDGYYSRVITKFLDQALRRQPITVYGRGEQTRSFCYVDDTIKATMLILQNKQTRGMALNIGNPREVKIIELAGIIVGLTNSSSEIEFHPLPRGDPMRRCPDISRAKSLLGWSPKIGLQEGITKTIPWVKSTLSRP